MDLPLVENLEAIEQLDDVRLDELLQRVDGVLVIQELALGSFLLPLG